MFCQLTLIGALRLVRGNVGDSQGATLQKRQLRKSDGDGRPRDARFSTFESVKQT
jgi:hypothetical protein